MPSQGQRQQTASLRKVKGKVVVQVQNQRAGEGRNWHLHPLYNITTRILWRGRERISGLVWHIALQTVIQITHYPFPLPLLLRGHWGEAGSPTLKSSLSLIEAIYLLSDSLCIALITYYSTPEIPSDFPYLGARSLRLLPDCSPRCAGRPTA